MASSCWPVVLWSCQEDEFSTNGTEYAWGGGSHESDSERARQCSTVVRYGSGSGSFINNPTDSGWRWSSSSHFTNSLAEESDDETIRSMERGLQQYHRDVWPNAGGERWRTTFSGSVVRSGSQPLLG